MSKTFPLERTSSGSLCTYYSSGYRGNIAGDTVTIEGGYSFKGPGVAGSS